VIIHPREYLRAPTLAALLRSMGGVVLLVGRGDRSTRASGVLLTPRLILTCSWAPRVAHAEVLPVDGKSAPEIHEIQFETEIGGATDRVERNSDMAAIVRREGAIFSISSNASAATFKPSATTIEQAASAGWIFLLSCPFGRREVVASIGTVLEVQQTYVYHDANSEPGSSGGAIVNANGELLGIHIGQDLENRRNRCVMTGALFADLARRRPDLWDEVRHHHRLHTGSEVQSTIDAGRREHSSDEAARSAYLRAAAGLWTFDPGTLVPFPPLGHGRTASSLLLDDVSSIRQRDGTSRWMLSDSARAEAIEDLGSLQRLQEARRQNPGVAPEGPQALLDRAIEAPDSLVPAKRSTQELEWLRAVVGWLRPIAPALPAVDVIDRALALRRLLGPFEALGGPHFRGREAQREQLESHLFGPIGAPSALVIHGVGGSGKSALLARFILDHTAPGAASPLPIAYLDFDRAILDARKPAGIHAEILRQIELQAAPASAPLTSSSAPSTSAPESLDAAPALLVAAINGATARTPGRRFLLVLDSFEEVQYRAGSQQGSPVAWLDALLAACPKVRVVLLGRARVMGLVVAGKPAETLRLGPLDKADARAMVESFGVTEPRAVEQLVAAARGNPLTLRVGAEFLSEASATDLDQALRGMPAHLIQGVLYDRVLERIHDPEVKRLARPGLVLRRVTPGLLRAVLAPIAGVEAASTAQTIALFEKLGRETFLAQVEQPSVIAHRPELRALTLRLLEQNDPDLVHQVDRAAAEYYAREIGAEARAEELYHRLRLNEPSETLERLWIPGVAELMQLDPDDELPSEAQAWVERKTTRGLVRTSPTPQRLDPAARDGERVWGSIWHALPSYADLKRRTAVERLEFIERAGAVADRAVTLGNAGELVRALVLSAEAAELNGDWLGASDLLTRGIKTRLLSKDVGQAVLVAHRDKLRDSGGTDLPVSAFPRGDDGEVLGDRFMSGIHDAAVNESRAFSRYIYGVYEHVYSGGVGEAIQKLGISGSGERTLASDARALASRDYTHRDLGLVASALGVSLSGSAQDTWENILRVSQLREDGHEILSRLISTQPALGEAVAELWIQRGRAAFYPLVLRAISRWIDRIAEKTAGLFTAAQVDEIGASFDRLTEARPGAVEELDCSLPEGVRGRLPQLFAPASQLRSNLRVLTAGNLEVLATWIEVARQMSHDAAPTAEPALVRALRSLGARTSQER
jgi:hypothetical protein